MGLHAARHALAMLALAACAAPRPLPPATRAGFESARVLGRALFERELLRRMAIKALAQRGSDPHAVQLWIHEDDPEVGLRAAGMVRCGELACARFHVAFGGGEGEILVRELVPPQPLEPGSRAALRAIRLAQADAADDARVPIVVPGHLSPDPGQHGALLVYLITTPRTLHRLVLGPNDRVTVRDEQVIERINISRGPEIDLRNRPEEPLRLTQKSGNAPTEALVFLSLLHGRVLRIGTEEHLYDVEGEHIRLHWPDR